MVGGGSLVTTVCVARRRGAGAKFGILRLVGLSLEGVGAAGRASELQRVKRHAEVYPLRDGVSDFSRLPRGDIFRLFSCC